MGPLETVSCAPASPSCRRIPVRKASVVPPPRFPGPRRRDLRVDCYDAAVDSSASSTSTSKRRRRPPPPLPKAKRDESELDQRSTPLLDAVLSRGSRTREAPFHVPGHKRGAAVVGDGRRRHPLARLVLGDEGRRGSDGASSATAAALSILRHDLTELPGLDLLSHPSADGPISEAQRLAAEAWRVSRTRFLVNGSTGGVAASVLACCRWWRSKPREEREVGFVLDFEEEAEAEREEQRKASEQGEEETLSFLSRPLVLVSRGAHRSAAAAAELAGADVFWIDDEGEREGRGESDEGDGSSLSRATTAAAVRRALELSRRRDALSSLGGADAPDEESAFARARVPAAVLVVSPTYFGACSDVAAVAEACSLRRGGCGGDGGPTGETEARVPLIVDQAHGAHFGLDPRFPPCAAAEASSSPSPPVVLAVASAHKTLAALGQSALLHSSAGVPPELQSEIDSALGALQTSSPSYLLLASLDAARAAAVGSSSPPPWDEPLLAASSAAEAVRSTPGASLLSDGEPTRLWDPLRLTVRLDGVGGRELAAALEADDGSESDDGTSDATAVVEMATSESVVLALGAGSTVEHAETFARALRRVAAKFSSKERGKQRSDDDAGSVSLSPSPSAASAAASPPLDHRRTTELVPLQRSLGRRAVEILAPYPPGIPLVQRGERVTPSAASAAAEAWRAGSAVVGLFSREGEGGEEPLIRVFVDG